MPLMLRLAFAALLTTASLLAVPANAQAPINDDLETARPIWAEQFFYAGTNVDATTSDIDASTSASCVGDFDSDLAVWWVFAVDTPGTVTIDLAQSSFDTIVSVHQLAGLGEVGCNDDDPDNENGDFTSKVTVSVVPSLYLVRVSGHDNDPQGTIQMSISGSLSGTDPIDGPPNDDVAFQVMLLLPDARHPDTSIGASVHSVDPAQSCGPTAGPFSPIWRIFRAPTDGTFTVNTNGSEYDTVLAVYTFVDGNFVEQGCNDDDPNASDNSSIVTIDVSENTPYYVMNTSFLSGDEGEVLFNTSFAPAVATEATPAGDVSLTATPNPARDAATVTLSVPETQTMTVEVFSVTGRRVATLHDGAVAAGDLALDLDASALPSGVYVVRAVGETVRLSERITVVR